MRAYRDLSRRGLLTTLGAGGGLLIGGGAAAQDRSVATGLAFADYPFQLGVAAGDPAPDGFVIWTRLAPEPL